MYDRPSPFEVVSTRLHRLLPRGRRRPVTSNLAVQLEELSSTLSELLTLEEQLISTERRLRVVEAGAAETEARFESLFSMLPTAAVLTDTTGRIEVANEQLYRLLEREREELPGTSLFALFNDGLQEQARAVLLALATTSRPVTFETQFVTPDGERIDTRVLLSILPGQETQVCWLLTDLRDRHRIEDLEQTQIDLARATEVTDQFMGLLSHELRTPLAIVFGNASMLARHREEIVDREHLTSIDEIEREAHHLIVMVENMLALARPTTVEEMEMLRLQHALEPLVRQAARRIHGREISVEVPAELAPVLGSPPHIVQVLENYLRNADKYSPPGEPIEVRVEERQGRAAVLICDHGPGVPGEEMARLFQPFFRSPSVQGRIRGIGLGLAVCKRMAEMQGGEVWVEPGREGGTIFGLSLPFSDITPV